MTARAKASDDKDAKDESKPVTREVYVDGTRYSPGDVPTAEHAELITNPKAWA